MSRPGASARREYERRHEAREARLRADLGGVGVFLGRVAGDPQSTQAWKKGAEGEERVAARLEKLLRDDAVRLLHDRRVPGSKANIDHLAIARGGVTVIDAKNYKGKIEVRRVGGLFSRRREELWIGGRNRTKLIDGLEGQIAVVREHLDAAGHTDVPVTGALCMANVDGLPLFSTFRVRGLMVDGAKPIAKTIRRSGEGASVDVDRVVAALESALRPAV